MESIDQRRRWRTTGLLALLATLVLAAAGCAKSESGSSSGTTSSTVAANVGLAGAKITGPADLTSQPKTGGQLSFGIEAETEGMDPTRNAFSSAGHIVASAVYDPLVTTDDKGKVVPYLAERFSSTPDFITWSFDIRSGVTFHDGEPLTPDIVKQNLEAHRVSPISALALRAVSQVDVVAPSTVKITLSEPMAAFPYVLTTQVGYIISPKMLADPELATKPIGTGAFRFDSHVKNESWKFVRYADYWRRDANGTQLPYLGGIEFKPIPDAALRLAGLEAGDLDVVMLYSPTEVKKLRESPQYKVVEYGDGEEDVITLNTQKPPFDKLVARQAMAYATDSAAWRNDVNGGVPRPAVGPFAPGQLGGGDQTGYPAHDPAKAKELVKQYEAETGQPFAFSYIATGGPLDQAEAQLLQKQWQEAGMQVSIEFKDQQALITQVVTGQYQAADWRNFGFPDPDADSVWFLSTSVKDQGVSLNVARFQSPEIDAAIKRSFATTDDKVRDEAYQQVAKILGENVAYLWLGRVNWVIAADERVQGLPGAANGSLSTLGPKTWLTTLWLS